MIRAKRFYGGLFASAVKSESLSIQSRRAPQTADEPSFLWRVLLNGGIRGQLMLAAFFRGLFAATVALRHLTELVDGAPVELLSRAVPKFGTSTGSSFSGESQISRDGRFVVFVSQAGNLTLIPPAQRPLGYYIN